MALLGISRKAPLFYLGQAIKLCFVWVPVGFVVMVSIGVLGYVADGWENKMAEHEAREVRLYNGDTTPLPDPDSKYEMN
ncbi:hypothetical protein [Corynebacterium aquatimens]|uniref:Uncharacterized protein n=1 Tax=Corynebacterium aquatimens TaxID=1190508 RepID=A0A931GS71_9CORY|nr:hypothetical protein [Corynebacterium aquatimens]MBG6121752.1 hypothetical protein [Corynebacterium aquatimens]WJY65709.1 hypothetical protein CAQUA_04980 [Corynebacterium aquatimens]